MTEKLREQKTLREQIAVKRQMLIVVYRKWMLMEITNKEYNQFAEEFIDSILSLLLKEVEGARLKELPECDWDMLNDLGDGSEESTTKIYAKVCLTAQLEAVKKILGKV